MRRISSIATWVAAFLLLALCLHAPRVPAAQSPNLSRMPLWELAQRMEDAYRERDQISYVAALTTIVRKYPADLDQLSPQSIFVAASKVWKSLASSDAMYGLYEALVVANWTQNGVEPEGLYVRYVRLLITREEWSKAQEVMRHLHSPRTVLGLRADRRSDPLLQESPGSLDIDAIATLHTKYLEAAVRQHPLRVAVWVSLLSAYRDAGRYREMLAITDQMIAQVARAGTAEKLFEDGEDFNWVYDLRGRAWCGLGDWAAAEREFKTAARMPEKGKVNVSDALNLANFYAEQGAAKSALEVLDAMAKRKLGMSEYGRMTEMRARHVAAVSSGSPAAADEALEFLRAHREIAREMLLEELIRTERFDEAAGDFAQWLEDPESRWDALAFVQDYEGVAQVAPAQVVVARNKKTWLGRADVQAAVEKVGRIEHVSLTAPSLW